MKQRYLYEIVDFQNGFAFSSKEYLGIENLGCEVFRMGYISRGGGFKEDDKPVYVSNESKGNQERYRLIQNDLAMAMTDMKNNVAILGCVAFIKESNRFLLNQRVGRLRVKDINKVNPRYLFYVLNSKDVLCDVRSRANSGVQVNLTTKGILDTLINLPSINVQNTIAHILGTLDDKIELNQKMNQSLEEIAKAIFKSWFVDFDPVHAKVDGRPTGLPDEISDLFPDEFVDSELGKIPKGWAVKTLKDVDLEIESGKRPKGGIDKDLIDGIPSVGAESIDTPGVFDFSIVKYVPEEFTFNVQKGWVKNYDVALYKDGAFVSKVSLYGDSFPFSKFMVNEHVFLLRSIKLGQFFLYRLFFSDLIKNQLIAMGTSKAAQPGLNQQEVASSTFICPTQKLSDYFNELVKPLVKKQLLLGKESQVLGSIRDALLPKLISGELQIPDAEKFLEDAGV